MRTVIAFDVSDNRRRYRVVRALEDLAERVQKSVFEAAELPDAAYLRLRSRLEGLVDAETDSLRYYRLCLSCARRTEWFGRGVGQVAVDPEFEVLRRALTTEEDLWKRSAILHVGEIVGCSGVLGGYGGELRTGRRGIGGFETGCCCGIRRMAP